jgi:3-oxoadipate enol-lactonase
VASAKIDPSLDMHYDDYCFVAPWVTAEPLVAVHGIAESGLVWFGLMPALSSQFRVLVPDLRGFGRSTVPRPGSPWTLTVLAADLIKFFDILGFSSVHLVGSKFGGTVAAHLAAQFPARVTTLCLLNALIRPEKTGTLDVSAVPDRGRQVGFAEFARESQRLRLGTGVSQAQLDWWNKLMSSADSEVFKVAAATAASVDLFDSLPAIQAPTLVVTSDRNPMAGLEWVLKWSRRLPKSELVVLPGDGYHVAAFAPEECARQVIAFIRRHRPDPYTGAAGTIEGSDSGRPLRDPHDNQSTKERC